MRIGLNGRPAGTTREGPAVAYRSLVHIPERGLTQCPPPPPEPDFSVLNTSGFASPLDDDLGSGALFESSEAMVDDVVRAWHFGLELDHSGATRRHVCRLHVGGRIREGAFGVHLVEDFAD